MKLTDNSPMPFGIHKGKPMIEVPASYLLYLHDTGKYTPDVQAYVVDNLDVLKAQAKHKK